MVLGDIFFKAENLGGMLEMMAAKNASAVLAVKHETDPAAIRRNFTVQQDETGRVRRVIEKPRHVQTTVKGCGLYLFDLPVFDAVRRTPRTAMRDEYEITDTIQIMVDDGLPGLAQCLPSDVRSHFLYSNRQSDLVQLGKRLCDLGGDVRRRLPGGTDLRVCRRDGTDGVEHSELTRPDREVERGD